VNAGGKVLVDERELWPDGRFVTTNVIARTAFVQQHPDAVRAFIEAHLDALAEIEAHPAAAQAAVIGQIRRITEQEIPPELLKASWANLEFSADPLAATLKESAEHAAAVGLLPDKPSDGFARLWDVDVLNDALAARGEPRVSA
ncbi:MAG: ABC transporter substrate-binding protein, partial [Propionibacteriaceae bacterium]|nr:ABC transporter substrate-binding protein [Propionibacteriaceae bacterium]